MTYFLSLFMVLWAVPVLAQNVAVSQATNSPNLSGRTSGSWSHAVSGTNRYLLVGLAGWDNSSTLTNVRVTYRGIALTSLGGTDKSGFNKARLWGLVNPPTGTHTIQVSNIPSGFAELGGGAISFTNVHQQTPTVGLVTELDGDASVTVSLSAGDLGVDIFYSGRGAAQPQIGSGGTRRTAVFCCGIKWFMMGTESGNGSVTMSWRDPDGSADFAQTALVLRRAGTVGLPITVDWAYEGSEGDVFVMERCTQPCGAFVPVASLPLSERRWTDTQVMVEHDYCYRMAVEEETFLGPYSNTMCSP